MARPRSEEADLSLRVRALLDEIEQKLAELRAELEKEPARGD